jgi:hypothetical protein
MCALHSVAERIDKHGIGREQRANGVNVPGIDGLLEFENNINGVGRHVLPRFRSKMSPARLTCARRSYQP